MRAAGATTSAIAAEAAAEAQRAERARSEAANKAVVAGASGAGSAAGTGAVQIAGAGGELAAVPVWLLAAMALVLFGTTLVFLWRARIQQARMQAYLDAEKGGT